MRRMEIMEEKEISEDEEEDEEEEEEQKDPDRCLLLQIKPPSHSFHTAASRQHRLIM